MVEIKKKIETLNEKFNSLHTQLICKGECDLADKLSEVYWQVQAANYKEGIEFMKELNKNK